MRTLILFYFFISSIFFINNAHAGWASAITKSIVGNAVTLTPHGTTKVIPKAISKGYQNKKCSSIKNKKKKLACKKLKQK